MTHYYLSMRIMRQLSACPPLALQNLAMSNQLYYGGVVTCNSTQSQNLDVTASIFDDHRQNKNSDTPPDVSIFVAEAQLLTLVTIISPRAVRAGLGLLYFIRPSTGYQLSPLSQQIHNCPRVTSTYAISNLNIENANQNTKEKWRTITFCRSLRGQSTILQNTKSFLSTMQNLPRSTPNTSPWISTSESKYCSVALLPKLS
jgi:hypothetical protein